MRRLSNLAKKSIFVLINKGPGILFEKIYGYLKGRYEFKKIKKNFLFLPEPTEAGINVVGYLCAEIGLGESVRTLIKSIKTTNIKHCLINYKLFFLENDDKTFEKEFSESNPYNINVIVINPDNLDTVISDLGKKFFLNRYNIGYWAWEVPEIPVQWKKYERYLNEIWVPSEFVKKAISKTIKVHVEVVPHSIEMKPFEKRGRSYFELGEEGFLFSFIFDYNGIFERKNPVAIVRSFKKAFNGNEKVMLVIKCSNSKNHDARHKMLLREIGEDKRIKIINKHFIKDEIYSLLDVSDAYLSLHRSEGFGFTMAEAMFLGKPVICTNYSGNTDFTKENNSFLVGYKKTLLEENIGPYKKGDEWAEPDIDEAAKFMRVVYENKELINEVGKRGREYIQGNFSPKTIGEIIEKRVEQIGQINYFN